MAAADRPGWTLLERIVLVGAVAVLLGVGLTVRASSRRRAELDDLHKLEAGLDASGFYGEGRRPARSRSRTVARVLPDEPAPTVEEIAPPHQRRNAARARALANARRARFRPAPLAPLAAPDESDVELPPGMDDSAPSDSNADDESELTDEQKMFLLDLYDLYNQQNQQNEGDQPPSPMVPEEEAPPPATPAETPPAPSAPEEPPPAPSAPEEPAPMPPSEGPAPETPPAPQGP